MCCQNTFLNIFLALVFITTVLYFKDALIPDSLADAYYVFAISKVYFRQGSFVACDSSSFPMLPVCPFKMKNVTLLIHLGLFIVDGISVYKSSL